MRETRTADRVASSLTTRCVACMRFTRLTPAVAAAITALALGFVSLAQAQEAHPPEAESAEREEDDEPVVVRTPEDLEWRDAPTGAAFATVYGTPAEAEPFAFRMRMPPDFSMRPHSHNTAEHITVLSGTLHMRFSHDGEAIELPPGSVISIPANRPMWAWTDQEETVIQVHGAGPFRTTPVEEDSAGSAPSPDEVQKRDAGGSR